MVPGEVRCTDLFCSHQPRADDVTGAGRTCRPSLVQLVLPAPVLSHLSAQHGVRGCGRVLSPSWTPCGMVPSRPAHNPDELFALHQSLPQMERDVGALDASFGSTDVCSAANRVSAGQKIWDARDHAAVAGRSDCLLYAAAR